jgi:hypothetical protein
MKMKTESPTTKVEQIEKEWDALWKLLKRRPFLFTVIALFAIASLGFNILVIPHLHKEIKDLGEANQKYKDENLNLNGKLSQKNSEVEQLQLELTPFKVFAIGKYGGDERKALAQLSQELSLLRQDFTAEKRTVREFHIRASLTFKGNWTHSFHGENAKLLAVGFWLNILNSGKPDAPPIKLYGEDFITKPNSNGLCACIYDASLTPGAFPSGLNLENLAGYDTFEIPYPGISPDKVASEPVTVMDARLYLFLNGKPALTLARTNLALTLDLAKTTPNHFTNETPGVFKSLCDVIR